MQSYDQEWLGPMRELVGDLSELYRLNDAMRLPRKERELFLSNETENPNFTYDVTRLQVERVDERIDNLLLAMKRSDTHALVVDLYERKLVRQRERHELLSAVIAGEDTQFYEASTALYGAPKKDHFAYVARQVTALCDTYETQASTAARRLAKVVSKITTTKVDISADILPTPVEGGTPLTSQAQAIAIFQETLDRFELSDWSIVERLGPQPIFAVRPESMQVVIPQEESLLERNGITDLKVRAIAEHEIGVHARRSANGMLQPLRLLGVGLDDYVDGEEGIASYVQQQTEGAVEFYGLDRYLAASLAVGMDGIPRDFRSVFSLMTDYFTLVHARDGIDKPAFKPAWDVCVRIFRGTSGSTPGAIYTKDIIYMEGNIGIWHLLSEKPQVFESLFIGKFNPLLTRHVKSLITLGIINEW